VHTVGRQLPPGSPGHTFADLAQTAPILPGYFNWVVHNAGKAHSVPRTQAERAAFFQTNRLGTAHLLKALEAVGPPQAFVLISSVAVYGLSHGENLPETSVLAATDPYGRSKIEAEQLVQAWCGRHGVRLTILRLPLVAGLNPPGNLGAMVAQLARGRYLGIGPGNARKSLVLAQDVAAIVPRAAQIGGIYHLTDGCHPTFKELETTIAEQLGQPLPRRLPIWLALMVAHVGDPINFLAKRRLFPLDNQTLAKITNSLTFDDQAARLRLGWQPTSVLAATNLWLGGLTKGVSSVG
jgi:nucleoside-diphosphate-sugar epimerase